MRVVLEFVDGPFAGRTIELNPGQSVQLGRTDRAQYPIPHDTYLSGLHFGVECEPDRARVRDLRSSNGTYLNGTRILEELLKNGDHIQAGQTTLLVRVDETPPEPILGSGTVMMPMPALATSAADQRTTMLQSPKLEAQLKWMQSLMSVAPNLYALLNAAGDPRIPALVAGSGEPYLAVADEMVDPGAGPSPYLVRVGAQSALVPRLIAEGWGKRWITWLSCPLELADLRLHLKRYLTLYTEDGRRVRFRFYHPPLLEAFLLSCSPEDVFMFFGPVRSIVMEGVEPEILVDFGLTPQGLSRKETRLAPHVEDAG